MKSREHNDGSNSTSNTLDIIRNPSPHRAPALIRLPRVKALTGLSGTEIYRRVAEGKFPRQVPLGGAHAVAWIESEILDWVEARIAEREDAPTRRGPPPRGTEARSEGARRGHIKRKARIAAEREPAGAA